MFDRHGILQVGTARIALARCRTDSISDDAYCEVAVVRRSATGRQLAGALVTDGCC
jgi:hypothetical protein